MSTYKGGVQNRRKRALARLEAQKAVHESIIKGEKGAIVNLKKGMPPTGFSTNATAKQLIQNAELNISYHEGQLPRIEKEISILKTRI